MMYLSSIAKGILIGFCCNSTAEKAQSLVVFSNKHPVLETLFYFWWYWGLNSGPHAYKASTLTAYLHHSTSPRFLKFFLFSNTYFLAAVLLGPSCNVELC
jgi:hypothetical protein